MKNCVHFPCIFSNSANISIAGPSVMHRNINEGGYLLVFRNDKIVNQVPGCSSQGLGLPYWLINLNITNNAISPTPRMMSLLRLVSEGTEFLYQAPKQYPSSITPVQGRNA